MSKHAHWLITTIQQTTRTGALITLRAGVNKAFDEKSLTDRWPAATRVRHA
jgi:hypothetical protein